VLYVTVPGDEVDVAPLCGACPFLGERGEQIDCRSRASSFRLDQRPAQLRRAGLGEVAAAAALARLLNDRVEAGQPGDLLGAAEAASLADLDQETAGQDRPDPGAIARGRSRGDRSQRLHDPVRL